jgi:hypothetical protein
MSYISDGGTGVIFGSTYQVEYGANGLGNKRIVFRITGPGGDGTSVDFLNAHFSANTDDFLALQALNAYQVGTMKHNTNTDRETLVAMRFDFSSSIFYERFLNF